MLIIKKYPALRYGAVYGALYLGTGISTPFMPSWFEQVGFHGAQIGMVLAFPMLSRIITGPMVGLWADGFSERRAPVFLLGLLAATSLALLLVTEHHLAIAILWFVAATAIAGMSPLIDVVVLGRAARESFAYAIPRGIGSAGYIAGSLGIGLLLAGLGATAVVAGGAAAALLAAIAVRALLPADKTYERATLRLKERLTDFRSLLFHPRFALIILVGGMLQGGNAYYYGFSALLWQDQGVAPGMVGALWGFGVAIEVAYLWFGEPFRKALGAERILMIAAGASILRWAILALSPPLWSLWPLQTLHALTLSAPFIASLQLVQETAPDRSSSAAQQLNAAVASGLILGSATLIGGLLYEVMGPSGYWIMAGMAVVGLGGSVRLIRTRQTAYRVGV